MGEDYEKKLKTESSKPKKGGVMNIQGLNRQGSRMRYTGLRASIILFSLLFSFTMWGCSALFLVPVTLKEVKDYVSEREQSFSHPLRDVVASAGYSLKQLDFKMKRIEYLGNQGLIRAIAKEAEVTLHLYSVTSNLTRMKSKISTREGIRYFSTEEELFNKIRKVLAKDRLPRFRDAGKEMTPVYIKPDIKASVIAYLATGEKVDINGDYRNPEWNEIEIKSGVVGYIAANHVKPLPKEKKTASVDG